MGAESNNEPFPQLSDKPSQKFGLLILVYDISDHQFEVRNFQASMMVYVKGVPKSAHIFKNIAILVIAVPACGLEQNLKVWGSTFYVSINL